MAKRNAVEVVGRDETKVGVVGVHILGTAAVRNYAATEVEVEEMYVVDIDAVLEGYVYRNLNPSSRKKS